ncbi:MAG: helix-turn-helix domain-containing protein [Candidatus Binataceae bacterium]
MLAIAHYAEDDGTQAFPSIATLVSVTGLSESSVHRSISKAKKSANWR